jgi:hypothetical protein
VIPAFLYPCFLCETVGDYKASLTPGSLEFTPDALTLSTPPVIPVTSGSAAFTGQAVDLIDTSVDIVSLSGSVGSPNTYFGFAQYPGGSAKQYLRANTNGKLEEANSLPNGTLGAYNQIGSEWVSPLTTYSGSYWIRATKISGDNLTSGTLGSWLALTSSNEWQLTAYKSVALGGIDYKETLLKLEISTSGTGSPIVATGYYLLQAEYDTLV